MADLTRFRVHNQYNTSQIIQYDDFIKKIFAVELIDAYPIAVNQLDLDWSSDGYHKLTVDFAYTYWKTK